MINVTCAIILKGHQILVTQRGESMKLSLKWEFPGGKIEYNETAEECLKREIKEELNIDIQIVKGLNHHQYQYPDSHICLIPFVCSFLNGNIILAEHKTFRWISKEGLRDLDWAEADIPVLEEFLSTEI
ncbi:MAG: (deoxy)nucleoside triphosphate pyrophosphohydrolase [Saprospiraceae bacterium]